MLKKIVFLLFIMALFTGMILLWTPGRARLMSSGPSAETLGLHVATEQGCFHCHGPAADGGVPNPGADKIPSLTNGAFLMDVHSQTDLEEWILDGAPRRNREQADFEPQKAKRAVAMPAYRDRLSEREFRNLLSWYHAVAGTIKPGDPLAASGMEVASELGCFSCHGPGGRFDLENPGSLVGRIPAWHGDDYEELVHSEAELREWILDGSPKRLRDHPVARRFLEGAIIKMPSYREKISGDQLQAIIAYINWLRDPNAPGHEPSFEGEEEEFDENEFY